MWTMFGLYAQTKDSVQEGWYMSKDSLDRWRSQLYNESSTFCLDGTVSEQALKLNILKFRYIPTFSEVNQDISYNYNMCTVVAATTW